MNSLCNGDGAVQMIYFVLVGLVCGFEELLHFFPTFKRHEHKAVYGILLPSF